MRNAFLALLTCAISACAALPSAHASILISIDKSAQRMVVEVDGVELYRWPVSTGREGRDTPSGSHRAFRLEKDHYSKEWDDAPMPNSIFFTQKGHAIHGSYDVKKIGAPASAGCVRLAPENAAKLFELVKARGVLNATVVITGDLQVALARQSRRTAARSGDDADVTGSIPRQGRPMQIAPDITAGELPPPDGYAERGLGRRGPRAQANGEPFELYAERMRRRYYQERAQQQAEQAERSDARRYYGYDGRAYYLRRARPDVWD